MADKPAFAKNERVWRMTLVALERNGLLDPAGEPANYPAANAIYQRLLRKHSPRDAEAERRERLLEREAADLRELGPGVTNQHSRSQILELDIGGWYVTRAGLFAHTAELTERLYFETHFYKIYPAVVRPATEPLARARGALPLVEPRFAWCVEVVADPNAGLTTYRVTPEVARYLLRDSEDALAHMAEQMRRSLALIDEAILDIEHEMPTVGGVEVTHSILDHRTSKDIMRAAKAAIENAIIAIPIRR